MILSLFLIIQVISPPWDTLTPMTENGHQYLFVAIHQFPVFILVLLCDKSTGAVACTFLGHVISPFTTPKVYLSDNELELEIQFLICRQFNIKAMHNFPIQTQCQWSCEMAQP